MNENLEYLQQLQQQLKQSGASWEAGENDFTHLPMEQWPNYLGCGSSDGEVQGTAEARPDNPPVQPQKKTDSSTPAIPTPEAKTDWSDPHKNRKRGCYVTSVLSQGSLGSCVAFATCALLESMARIAKNAPVDTLASVSLGRYSESHLFSLRGKEYTSGWNIKPALEACQDTGVIPSYEMPYLQGLRSPDGVRAEGRLKTTKISDYSFILKSDAQFSDDTTRRQTMMQWLDDTGPLLASFVTFPSFHHYEKGVYSRIEADDSSKIGNHAVLVVGYDDTISWTDRTGETKTGAWLVKNSWGSNWGMKDRPGYFWIGFGECGFDDKMWSIKPAEDFSQVYEDTLLVSRGGRLCSYSASDSDWRDLGYTKVDESPDIAITMLATHPAIASGAVFGLAEDSFSLHVRCPLSGKWSPVTGSDTITPNPAAPDAKPKALIVSAKEILDNSPITVVTSQNFTTYVAPPPNGQPTDRRLHCGTRTTGEHGKVTGGEWKAEEIHSLPPPDGMPKKACGAGDNVPVQRNASSWLYVWSQGGKLYRLQDFSWNPNSLSIVHQKGPFPSLTPDGLFAALPDGSILAQNHKGQYIYLPLTQDANWDQFIKPAIWNEGKKAYENQRQLVRNWTTLQPLESDKTNPGKAKGAVISPGPYLIGGNADGLFYSSTFRGPWMPLLPTQTPLSPSSFAIDEGEGLLYAVDEKATIWKMPVSTGGQTAWVKADDMNTGGGLAVFADSCARPVKDTWILLHQLQHQRRLSLQ